MTKRKQSATVDLKVRMKEPLRASLEHAAKKRGVSLNAEAVRRLEQSFSSQDFFEQQIGGPEVRHQIELMTAAFTHAGKQQAAALGHPEWSAAQWMSDGGCYRAAVFAVFEALMVASPNADWGSDNCALEVESLKGRIATWLINTGRLKLAGKEGPMT